MMSYVCPLANDWVDMAGQLLLPGAELVPKIMANRPSTSLALTVMLVLALHFAIRLYRHRRFFKNLPGPPHSFLWGHLPIMGAVSALFPNKTHLQTFFTEIAQKYNLTGIFYLDLWPLAHSQVVLTDPALLEQVTVTKVLPHHKLGDDFLASIVGRNSIATANGAVWKELHNTLAPAFSWSAIRNLARIVVEECELFREALDQKAATGDILSLEDLGSKLTFDIIGRAVFNMKLQAQTTGSAYLDDLKTIIALADGATDITTQLNPVLRAKAWWRRQKVLGRLHPRITAQIEDRFNLLLDKGVVPGKKDYDSILDLALREKLAKSQGERVGLSADDMRMLVTNIKALLLGGQGTSTTTICFMYMLLSKHQEVVQALRAEHSAVLGATHSLTTQTLLSSPEKLQALPYTEAVIKESLRLFPVGFGVRSAPPTATLTFDGRKYPIGNDLVIVLNGHDLHYNASHFPDPTAFKPERWLDSDCVPKTHFRSFGRGPRACLGQNLAINDLKIIMAMTLRDFEFECVGVSCNKVPRGLHTNLDVLFGDIIYQELRLEAKPRGGMMMTVRRIGDE